MNKQRNLLMHATLSNGAAVVTAAAETFSLLRIRWFPIFCFAILAIVVVSRNSRFLPLQFALLTVRTSLGRATSTFNYFVDCWRFNQSKRSLAAATITFDRSTDH